MIKTENLVDILKEQTFLKGFLPQHVEKLAALANEVRFERDQIIFRQGDESSLFYLISLGKVALEVSALGRTIRVETLDEGDELGWSSLLASSEKQFQARALGTVRALAFDGARLREMCEEDPAFGYTLMRRLLGVVAKRLQATRIQLLDMYSPGGGKP